MSGLFSGGGLFNGVSLVLLIPVVAAALLVFLPGYRLSARLNMLASFLTLLAALPCSLGIDRLAPTFSSTISISFSSCLIPLSASPPVCSVPAILAMNWRPAV